MYLVFYVCRQRRNRFNMDHMPKVFGVFMLGLFFLRSTGIFTKSCIVNVRQKITTSFRLIIRQQRYPQSNWLWIFNRENDYMKKIKYITAFCMMICIIVQLNTNVSANENNICYVAHRGYTKYAPEIQFLYLKPQAERVFKQWSVISMKLPRIRRVNVDL